MATVKHLGNKMRAREGPAQHREQLGQLWGGVHRQDFATFPPEPPLLMADAARSPSLPPKWDKSCLGLACREAGQLQKLWKPHISQREEEGDAEEQVLAAGLTPGGSWERQQRWQRSTGHAPRPAHGNSLVAALPRSERIKQPELDNLSPSSLLGSLCLGIYKCIYIFLYLCYM